jgi:hypothetical protein
VEKEMILNAGNGVIIRSWKDEDVSDLVALANDRDVWINLRDALLVQGRLPSLLLLFLLR